MTPMLAQEKHVGNKRIHEEKIEMIPVDNNVKSGNPSDPFEHPFPYDDENGEYEICLFSDRRFGREAKHVILDIAKTSGNAQPKESKESSDQAEDLDRFGSIEGVETLVTDIMAEQTEKENRLIRRTQATKDNHNSMGQSSLMETLVLVVVSVGQIIFVRRWFQGKGTLLKQWA